LHGTVLAGKRTMTEDLPGVLEWYVGIVALRPCRCDPRGEWELATTQFGGSAEKWIFLDDLGTYYRHINN
jgi:hypothetical protein